MSKVMAYLNAINKKSGNTYRIEAFKSYIIEQSLDVPAGQFSFIIGNYNGEVSNSISAGDEVLFYIDGQLAFIGIIDEMTVRFGLSNMDVELSGRDKVSLLLDNECEPVTYKKITLESLIQKRVLPFGIKTNISNAGNTIDKVVINGGESEWSIIDKYIKQRGLYARFEKDSLVVGNLKKDSNEDYLFSNDEVNAIKIKSMLITISSEIATDVIVYADDNDKHKGIKAIANADAPFKMKKVSNEDVQNNTEAKKKADELIKEINRGAFAIQITTHTKKPLPINKIVRVKSKKLNLNVLMLIDKTVYTFDDNGSNTEITLKLIDGVTNKWANHTIPKV